MYLKIENISEKKLIQNKKVLEFISQNGEALASHIFFNVHNIIAASSDYFWDILKNTKMDRLFQDESHAFLVLLTTFISIRTEIEMQAVYGEYGDDVYRKLGEYISSYYHSFLRNYTEDVEDKAAFLMHHAHETVINNEGSGIDRLLAVQFKTIAAADVDFSPDLFQPLMPAFSEGGPIVDIIEDNN